MNSQNIAEQYVQEPVCGWEVRCRSAGFNRDAGSGRQDEGHEWESMCSGNIDPGTLPLPPLDDPVTFTLQQLLPAAAAAAHSVGRRKDEDEDGMGGDKI